MMYKYWSALRIRLLWYKIEYMIQYLQVWQFLLIPALLNFHRHFCRLVLKLRCHYEYSSSRSQVILLRFRQWFSDHFPLEYFICWILQFYPPPGCSYLLSILNAQWELAKIHVTIASKIMRYTPLLSKYQVDSKKKLRHYNIC